MSSFIQADILKELEGITKILQEILKLLVLIREEIKQ